LLCSALGFVLVAGPLGLALVVGAGSRSAAGGGIVCGGLLDRGLDLVAGALVLVVRVPLNFRVGLVHGGHHCEGARVDVGCHVA
jgi:hypothetical protein